jgi:transcriptional regulator with XRE-family HTH domain
MERKPSPIKRILDERGITYTRFAELVGLPHAVAFHRIESGEQKPPADYYERARLILGVPIELLRPEPEPVAATA